MCLIYVARCAKDTIVATRCQGDLQHTPSTKQVDQDDEVPWLSRDAHGLQENGVFTFGEPCDLPELESEDGTITTDWTTVASAVADMHRIRPLEMSRRSLMDLRACRPCRDAPSHSRNRSRPMPSGRVRVV